MSTKDKIEIEVSELFDEWADRAKGAGERMVLYMSQRSQHIVQNMDNPNIGLILAAERANLNLHLAEQAVQQEDAAVSTAKSILVTMLQVLATALLAKVETI